MYRASNDFDNLNQSWEAYIENCYNILPIDWMLFHTTFVPLFCPKIVCFFGSLNSRWMLIPLNFSEIRAPRLILKKGSGGHRPSDDFVATFFVDKKHREQGRM